MPWLPVFKIGFWNAWILSLFLILHPYLMNLVDKTVGTGNLNQKMGDGSPDMGKKKQLPVPTLLLSLLFIVSIFIPLRSGAWLWIGLAVYFIGIAIFLSSIITAARTPLGQVFTQGMYRFSRHPLYLSFFILMIGISLASLSWLFLLLSMLWMIFPISQVGSEEKSCLDTLGNAYRNYMDRTPKWLGIPK